MLKFILLALSMVCLSGPQASAVEPAAPWPDAARSRPLPRPSWVLVVPARRLPSGALSIWDRTDSWARMWRAPATIDGLRFVPVFGDDQDKRSITAEAIDGMIVDSLDIVMRKYGAPAIALAVTDGNSVALAGWVPGWSASWEPSEYISDPSETRKRALSTLSSMFRSTGQARSPVRETTRVNAGDIEIEAYRTGNNGETEYRLVLLPAPGGTAEDARSTLEQLPGLVTLSAEPYAEGLRLVVSKAQGRIEAELRALGFSVR
ncbi:hypothetical protein [Bosea sp. RAC05]|mgnify:CR=1 FL=1|uniref:hypothetical protein n=1 Tax=Bosea sp. RAC05 TaxID=1842539 RepID=UPI00085879B2|nr:hypothetical protein [Bosea sp. RAC05]AOG03467.1 hypothetical protein BSY19_5002 [Bosea sp. RAC05]